MKFSTFVRSLKNASGRGALIFALAALTAACAHSAQISNQEIFVSSGGQQKITLSRHPVIGYTVQVLVNGMQQSSVFDYTCDANSGAISFLRSLNNFDTIVVNYAFDSAKATASSTSLNNPFAVSLLSEAQGGVSASLGNLSTDASGRAAMGMGVNGNWKTANGFSLASNAAYDPASAGPGSSPQLQLADTLAYSHKQGGLSFGGQSAYTGTTRYSSSLASQFNVSDQFSKALTVTTNYTRADNFADPSSTTDTIKVDAVIKPIAPLSVEATSSTTNAVDNDTYVNSVSASVAAPLNSKLTAAYSDTANPTAETQVNSFGVATDPAAFLALNGNYKTRDTTSTAPDDALDTYGGQATIKIAKPLQLTGIYCQNPDDSGQPLALSRRGVGVTTTIGPASLTTNYTVDVRTAASEDTPDSKFGLTGKLALDRATSLTGQYQDTNYFGYATRVRAYSLGLTHNISGLLQVSLTGSVNVQGDDSASQVTDAESSASVGLKF